MDKHIHTSHELHINDNTESRMYASYLDHYPDKDTYGRLQTGIYHKRDDFIFPTVKFPFLSSNISNTPSYVVCIYQLIRYKLVCSDYMDFVTNGVILIRKLLQHSYEEERLKLTIHNHNCHCLYLVDQDDMSSSQLRRTCLSKIFRNRFSVVMCNFYRFCPFHDCVILTECG